MLKKNNVEKTVYKFPRWTFFSRWSTPIRTRLNYVYMSILPLALHPKLSNKIRLLITWHHPNLLLETPKQRHIIKKFQKLTTTIQNFFISLIFMWNNKCKLSSMFGANLLKNNEGNKKPRPMCILHSMHVFIMNVISVRPKWKLWF